MENYDTMDRGQLVDALFDRGVEVCESMRESVLRRLLMEADERIHATMRVQCELMPATLSEAEATFIFAEDSINLNAFMSHELTKQQGGYFPEVLYSINNIADFAASKAPLWTKMMNILNNISLAFHDKLESELYFIVDAALLCDFFEDDDRGMPFHVQFHRWIRSTIYGGLGDKRRASSHVSRNCSGNNAEVLRRLDEGGIYLCTVFSNHPRQTAKIFEALTLRAYKVGSGKSYLYNTNSSSGITVLQNFFTESEIDDLAVLLLYKAFCRFMDNRPIPLKTIHVGGRRAPSGYDDNI